MLEKYLPKKEKEHAGYCLRCGYRRTNLNGYGVCKQCREKKGYN